MTDDVKSRIAVINDRLVETRHYIHRWPELSDFEEKTSEFVAGRLRALGLAVKTDVGGHDGHTTTLLGTAEVLTSLRDQIRGSVRFLFQPAEETVGGAKRMCEE